MTDRAPTQQMGCCNNYIHGTSNRRWPIAIGVLLALLWQGLLVQAHVHAPPIPRTLVRQGAATPLILSSPARSDDGKDCPICRELAHAGHYLAPVAPAFAHRIAALVAPGRFALPSWPRRHAAHGWYGRGPPPLSTHADF